MGSLPANSALIVSALTRAASFLTTRADLERALNRLLIAQITITGLLFVVLRIL